MPKIPAPKGRDKAKTREAVELSHDLIAEAYPELTQALIDKAKGLWFLDPTVDDPSRRVYQKEPDTTALIRALEILGGKPVARVETGEIGAVTEFEDWIKSQVKAPDATTIPLAEHLPQETLALVAPLKKTLDELEGDAMDDVVRDLKGWE